MPFLLSSIQSETCCPCKNVEQMYYFLKFMKNILLVGLAAFCLMLCNGCGLFVTGNSAAGPGTVYYLDGELRDSENYSMETVHVATRAALADLQFAVVTDTQDAAHFQLRARTSTDTKVDITLTKQSPTLTEIRIRAGTSGDEALSRQLLAKIKAHL